jgi:hypothetical protein
LPVRTTTGTDDVVDRGDARMSDPGVLGSLTHQVRTIVVDRGVR